MTVDLHYEMHGDPAAPPVLLLGSLGANLHMWDPQIHALWSGHHVIAVDHRGHGGSPAPAGPYTMADLGGDVIALLDRLGLDSVHFVGLSLGGAVGQWLAAHHPQRLRTLTVMCTSAQFTPAQPWLDRAATVRADGIASIAESVVGRWFTPELAQRDPELVARHVAMVSGSSDEGYAACCEALSQWDGRADLARIVAPTLVIAAEQDGPTPPPKLQAIADSIAGAEFHVVSPGAHLANVEQAGAITRLIERHIAAATPVGVARRAVHDVGMSVRRSVLGDAHVDRAIAGSTPFTEPFQDFITRTAWGDIWARDGLDHPTRRLLTLAILTAVGNEHELDMHIRAALRAGMDPDQLVEVFLHTAVYAGVPNSNRAFALGKQALADLAGATDGSTRT
ncbi:3-oxoadipate enol-lactonase [Prescottella agglutinans]|uniref:3-oxoadipate enol-lactonase/4-carboxymuconolactone decarboxylase n=1 Tax=Prescottella agglutinans TaxID=1644129 RepID=A0ABT6M555_9NOCA|nr:3-oxoadipate enol-lactonase [Prescottella agglutinans]MDH6279446.1 3-oxoadipate enol-lactonase/4-carboxymuconolactone decarboxylase [Prescottella agglutinans]